MDKFSCGSVERTGIFDMGTCIWLQAEEGNCYFPIYFTFLAEQGALGLAGKPRLEVAFILIEWWSQIPVYLIIPQVITSNAYP